jgi:hypothetical protein
LTGQYDLSWGQLPTEALTLTHIIITHHTTHTQPDQPNQPKPAIATMGLPSLCEDKRRAVEITWYTAMVVSVAYVIAAFVVATRLHKSDTPAATQPAGFAAIWSMILLVLILVGGTVVFRRIQTPMATGAFVPYVAAAQQSSWGGWDLGVRGACLGGRSIEFGTVFHHSINKFDRRTPPINTHRRFPWRGGHVQQHRAHALRAVPGPEPAGAQRGGGQRLRMDGDLRLLPLCTYTYVDDFETKMLSHGPLHHSKEGTLPQKRHMHTHR